MCALIEANFEEFSVDDEEREVVCFEASAFLRRRAKDIAGDKQSAFDIVFFDPPYATDYEVVLNYIGRQAATLLAEDGLMIVEHHKKNDPRGEFGDLRRYRSLKQGDSGLGFYRRGIPN